LQRGDQGPVQGHAIATAVSRPSWSKSASGAWRAVMIRGGAARLVASPPAQCRAISKSARAWRWRRR
jgi:hypothetical protein